MGRKSDVELSIESSQVSLLEHISECHISLEADGLKVECHVSAVVVRIIDGKRPFLSLEHLHILDEDVASVLVAHEVSLLIEWVLIECDKFPVSKESECG